MNSKSRLYTVGSLSTELKRGVEQHFGDIYLTGEVTGYRAPRAANGHHYFSLREGTAKINAVIWSGIAQYIGLQIQDGMQVKVFGRVTIYAPSSLYQIQIRKIEYEGNGKLMAELSRLRNALFAKGYLTREKLPSVIPIPSVIGVVTSLEGAAFKDILARIKERYPLKVIIWPCNVQGDLSAKSISQAIDGFNNLPSDTKISIPDLLIVGRGGGSMEDLWSFNAEEVVLAAVKSKLTIISAVGHETDTVLLDEAAHYRAATPTAAAEIAVPERRVLLLSLSDQAKRMNNSMINLYSMYNKALGGINRRLKILADFGLAHSQLFDRLANALETNRQRFVFGHSTILDRLYNGLNRKSYDKVLENFGIILMNLHKRLTMAYLTKIKQMQMGSNILMLGKTKGRLEFISNQCKYKLQTQETKLIKAFDIYFKQSYKKLKILSAMHSLLNYRSTLLRGYSVVRDDRGNIVMSSKQVRHGQSLELEVQDGNISTVVDQS